MAHFGVQKIKKLAIMAGVAGIAGVGLLPIGDASAKAQIPEDLVPNMIEIIGSGSAESGSSQGPATTGSGRLCWADQYCDNKVKDNMAYPLSYSFRHMSVTVYPKDGQTFVLKNPNGNTVSDFTKNSNGNYNVGFDIASNGDIDGDYQLIATKGGVSKTYTIHVGQDSEGGSTHENDRFFFAFKNADGDIWQEEFLYGQGLNYSVKRPYGYDNLVVETIRGCAGEVHGSSFSTCASTGTAPTASNLEDYSYSVKLGNDYIAYDGDNVSSAHSVLDGPMYLQYVGGGLGVFQNEIFQFNETYPYTLVEFTDGDESAVEQIDFVTDGGNTADFDVTELDFLPNKATCKKGTGSVDLEYDQMNVLTCQDSDGNHIVNIDLTGLHSMEPISLKEDETKKPDDLPDGAENGTWGVTDPNVCEVADDGTITAKGVGTCKVVLGLNGEAYVWKIKVESKNPDTLDKGQAMTFATAGAAIAGLGAMIAAAKRFIRR